MARSPAVYLLASRSRVLYVGVTSDLERRLAEHRAGSGFTGRYRVDRLVYVELHTSMRDAIAREKQIKGWVRARKVALVEQENSTWRDLARRGDASHGPGASGSFADAQDDVDAEEPLQPSL